MLISTSAYAETLVQLRERVNTWLTNHVGGVNGLVARQNAYYVAHNNRFWQGLITHSAIPFHQSAVTGDAPADRLSFHPTDQADTWEDMFPEWSSETFAAAAKIDVYNGPTGKGWILTVYVRFNGVTYARCKSFGPNTSFDFDWRVYDESG